MTSDEATSMPLHRALAKALAAHGVGTLFGLIGDANLFMVESFIKNEGGRFIAAAHEASAVLMAFGFAQASGTVAAATVTHGPGLTNTITPLVEASRSNVPLVLLCGDTPAADREHLQKIDQRELVAATGAGFEPARCAGTAVEDLARAFQRAASEQRPIVFNMPVDYQWADVPYEATVLAVPEVSIAPGPSDAFDDALGIVAAAKRPIVLAGRGAAGARRELVDLARRIDAPLATTLRASGLFAGEPSNLGVFGTLSTPVATDVILESDCVIAFGAGLNAFTAGRGTFLRDKRIVQVDVDRRAMGRRARPTVGVIGSAGLVARRMVELLDEAEIPGSEFVTPAMLERIRSYRPEPVIPGYKGEPAAGTVDLRKALLRLDAVIAPERNVVADLGRFSKEAWKAFPVADPSAMIHAVSFGSIGLGLATAVGAAAKGGKPTVLLCGDGGFMMSGFAELHTIVRERLDVVVILCNDGSYGAEHVQFRNRSMDPGLSLFAWPDFAPVAEALGCTGLTVRNAGDLEAAARAIVDRTGPVLVDIKLDPERIPWG